MPQNSQILKNIEKEIAGLLVEKMESFDIDIDRASQIAQFVLDNLPDKLTDEQVLQIIPKLDDNFWELSGIVQKYLTEYETKYKDQRIHEVRDLIHHEHFDQPRQLVKQYWNTHI